MAEVKGKKHKFKNSRCEENDAVWIAQEKFFPVYFLKKAGQLVLSLLVLSVLVFFISRLAPGEPLRAFYGDAVERMGPEQLAAARDRLGLDENLFVQYWNWLTGALTGDFGISFQYKQDVLSVVGKVSFNTLILTLVSFMLIFVLGLLLAVFCVMREDKAADRIIRRLGVAANSVPEFLAALLFMFIFSVSLGLLPSSGAYSIGQSGNIADRALHLILPVAAIVFSHLWYCAYLMRNKLSDEIRKEYVLLCRVKGLSEREILFKHCLKNIMPAIVSIMAVFLPHLLGGTYIVEMVFSYPGLGTLGFESAQYHDYNMLMVIALITGFFVITANMLAQAVNEKLDPRMRYGERISVKAGGEGSE